MREYHGLELFFWHKHLKNLTKYMKKPFSYIREWPARNSKLRYRTCRTSAPPLSRLPVWRQFSVCDGGKNMVSSLSWVDKDLSSRMLETLEYLQGTVPEKRELCGESIPELCIWLPQSLCIANLHMHRLKSMQLRNNFQEKK